MEKKKQQQVDLENVFLIIELNNSFGCHCYTELVLGF